MNIFYVDTHPKVAAQCLVDKHVIKMILESAQLLCTAHHLLSTESFINDLQKTHNVVLYKATHKNHPSAVWVRENSYNYIWVAAHLMWLLEEYDYRYGKVHKTNKLMALLKNKPENIIDTMIMTPFRCAMPEEYIVSDDPVENYRLYYKLGKAHLHKWTKRNPPDWIK